MVDHHHVTCDKLFIVELQEWRPTPLPTYHPTCYEAIEDCILFKSYFVLNVAQMFNFLSIFCPNDKIEISF
jgi:hypothetical protein